MSLTSSPIPPPLGGDASQHQILYLFQNKVGIVSDNEGDEVHVPSVSIAGDPPIEIINDFLSRFSKRNQGWIDPSPD